MGNDVTADPDAVLVKLSAQGDALWVTMNGGPNELDRGRAVAITPEGDVVWGGQNTAGAFVELVEASGAS